MIQVGLMTEEWFQIKTLETFYSLLNYSIDDFTPYGNLCYINDNGEILHQIPLQELST